MKLFEIPFYSSDDTVLMEANVLNAADKFGAEHSIRSYVNGFTQHIPSPQVKKVFVKKLSKLFLNDERFHQAVRELPDDAPDWARQAIDNRELVKFLPTPELTDQMEHLTHYVIAMDTDAKSPENNTRLNAERELQGFSKAENLATLISKSNEFFKRGGKKALKSEEGMKEIMDAGNGFKWFLLQTAEAFKNAGKVLQNCIGGYWSEQKSKTNDMSIIVLKKSNGEMVVATRINNSEHRIEEMKGKNNKPPIDKYMSPVIKFLEKHKKLKLSSMAQRDFANSGYHHIQGMLYSRDDAIQQFLQHSIIHQFPDGRTIRQVDISNLGSDVNELARLVYKGAGLEFVGTEQYSSVVDMVGGKSHIFGLIADQILEQTSEQSAQQSKINESEVMDRDMADFVKFLKQNGYIKQLGAEVSKKLVWEHGLKLTKDGELERIEPAEKVQHSDGGHKWDKHTDLDTIQSLHASLRGETKYGRNRVGKIDVGIDDLKSIHITKVDRRKTNFQGDDVGEESHPMVVVQTHDGKMHPALVKNGHLVKGDIGKLYNGSTRSQYQGRGYFAVPAARTTSHYDLKDHKSVQSIIDLANHEDGTLPDNFVHEHGIIRGENDKYEILDPSKHFDQVSDTHSKMDLSKYSTKERLHVIAGVSQNVDFRPNANKTHPDRDHENYFHGNDLNGTLVRHGAHGVKGKKGLDYSTKQLAIDSTRDWSASGEDIIKNAFGKKPDTIHKVITDYGIGKKNEALILTSGNTIVKIDDATGEHDFQSWDDYERVAAQINQFASKNGLKFARTAVSNKKEFTIAGGQLVTVSQKQKLQLDRMKATGKVGTETTDTLPFKDGTKIVRMTQEEQTDWARKEAEVKTATGQAWKVVDPEGRTMAVTLVKNGEVQSTYTHDQNDVLSTKSRGHYIDEYVKGAIDAFKWTVKDTSQFIIKPNTQNHRALKKWANPGRYKYYASTVDKELLTSGLIERVPHNQQVGVPSRRIRFNVTDTGRMALISMDAGESYNHVRNREGNDVHPDFQMPEPKKVEPTPAPEARPYVPNDRPVNTGRTGTKAAQALDWFRQHVTDNERIPTRGEFITRMMDAPFNMSKAGAGTYYQNTKGKYAKLGESLSYIAAWELMLEGAGTQDSTFKTYLLYQFSRN